MEGGEGIFEADAEFADDAGQATDVEPAVDAAGRLQGILSDAVLRVQKCASPGLGRRLRQRPAISTKSGQGKAICLGVLGSQVRQ